LYSDTSLKFLGLYEVHYIQQWVNMGSHIKILDARGVAWSYFLTGSPQIWCHCL